MRERCIGVDLDNTVICYDQVILQTALDRSLLPPKWNKVGKHDMKSEIERRHGCHAWTALQAEIYGPRIDFAEAFAGVQDFFRECRAQRVEVCIISHKTRFAALGGHCDLHRAALGWLARQGWFDDPMIGLSPSNVEFHDSLTDKLAAIARRQCAVFIDDLPHVLTAPEFPLATRRILFDPCGSHAVPEGAERVSSWRETTERTLAPKVSGPELVVAPFNFR